MRRASGRIGGILRLIHKLVLVVLLGIGALVAAAIGFVSYGFIIYLGSSWVVYFLSAAGIPYDARGRIVAPFMTPEAWLYYAPGAAVLLYITGIAMFCASRSLLLRRRNRAPPTR